MGVTGMVDADGIWVGTDERPDTYRLLRLLGGGAEGEVWEAELPLSAGGRRRVAVKILPPDALRTPPGAAPDTVPGQPAAGAADAASSLDWRAHGDLLKSLAAPGLVRVVDVFAGPPKHHAGSISADAPAAIASARRTHYVVMDYVEGVSLQRWVEEHPDAGISERLQLLGTAASGLDELHAGAATGVPAVHGDIKPGNIVIDGRGTAVLVDLGLAQLMDGSRRQGLTYPYAAPELHDPAALPTPDSDRFAFVATVVHLLTAETPAEQGGRLDVAGVRDQLDAVPALDGRDALKDSLICALEAAPGDRPRTLRPWLSALTHSMSTITRTSLNQPTSLPDASKPADSARPGTQADGARADAGHGSAAPPAGAAPTGAPSAGAPPAGAPPAESVHLPDLGLVDATSSAAVGSARPGGRRGQALAAAAVVVLVAAAVTVGWWWVGRNPKDHVTVAAAAVTSTPPSGSTPVSSSSSAPSSTAAPTTDGGGAASEVAPAPAPAPVGPTDVQVVTQPVPVTQPGPTQTSTTTETATSVSTATIAATFPQLSTNYTSISYNKTGTTGTVQLSNTGTGTAAWSASVSGVGFSATPGSGTLAPGASVTVTIQLNRTGLAEGNLQGTVTFTAGSSSRSVALTGSEEHPPVISSWQVSPNAVYPGGTRCTPQRSTVTVNATDENWISAILYWGGTSTQMTPTGSGFTATTGTYTGTGSTQLTVRVTDSRGNWRQVSTSITVKAC